MIQVVRITGEDYDLNTGEAHPKSLVLSNGYREMYLPVDDNIVRAILQLAVENQPEDAPVERGNGGCVTAAPVLEDLEAIHQELAGVTDSVKVRLKPASEELPDDPVEEVYEPGEEYSDPATGVGSL
jgi:hypothetical protein